MNPPVRCSCGMPLGQVHQLYVQMRAKLIYESLTKLGYKPLPEYMDMIPDLNVSVGEILDNLRLDSECCRMRIMSQVYDPVPLFNRSGGIKKLN